MLSEIRAYLASRGRSPLSDIALHLGIEASAARGMLEQLMRKSRVIRVGSSCESSCGKSCGVCGDASATEFYELSPEA